jgi:hypothetical protein
MSKYRNQRKKFGPESNEEKKIKGKSEASIVISL